MTKFLLGALIALGIVVASVGVLPSSAQLQEPGVLIDPALPVRIARDGQAR